MGFLEAKGFWLKTFLEQHKKSMFKKAPEQLISSFLWDTSWTHPGCFRLSLFRGLWSWSFSRCFPVLARGLAQNSEKPPGKKSIKKKKNHGKPKKIAFKLNQHTFKKKKTKKQIIHIIYFSCASPAISSAEHGLSPVVPSNPFASDDTSLVA